MSSHRRLHRVARRIDWALVAMVAPFYVLFLMTTIGRFTVPFELEWNEGHSAEQALRFAQGLPLYPAPETDCWVPYMYAPLYHWLFGGILAITGNLSLVWGRLISILATCATGVGIGWTVRNVTRHSAAAWFAGLLYFAFFAPTGFWFDIARNDALAFGLCVWGMGLTLGRGLRPWQIAAGFGCFILGALAKQTVGPVAIVCAGILLLRGDRTARWMTMLTILLGINLLIIYTRTGNEWFWKYVVTNAGNHLSDWNVLIPQNGAPPKIWVEGLRFVAWLAVPILAWLVASLAKRRRLRGGLFLLPVGLLALGAVGGYAKFGGYINNFLPMFLGVSLITGLAYAGLARSLCGGWRFMLPFFMICLMILQIFQPGFKTGLLYKPQAQWPDPESMRAYEALMTWLRERRDADEEVWVFHHQWYGIQTGHPTGPNVDMVRCATYAGDLVPHCFDEILESGEYKWLVMDSTDIQYEWLAPGIDMLIMEYYEPVGVIPGYETLSWKALGPVTGAPVRPQMIYQRRDER